jgi:serine/threonine protein kinase
MTEEKFLSDHPELKPFVLCNVCETGTEIGKGANSIVREVDIPGCAAAKMIVHDAFVLAARDPEAAIRDATTKFTRECQLMSALRHPNIVQFLGVAFFPGFKPKLLLPALIMERLLTNLHDMLVSDTRPPSDTHKQFLTLGVKCSILKNVACGLVYLHERTPSVIHRKLSAKNVLLDSQMVAKIADLSVARTVTNMTEAAVMSKAPENPPYMPPT